MKTGIMAWFGRLLSRLGLRMQKPTAYRTIKCVCRKCGRRFRRQLKRGVAMSAASKKCRCGERRRIKQATC
jgi:hypothetical protein